MSAWYVFSALGFFPANPASGDYVLGSPLVSRAVLHLDPAYYPGAKGHAFTLTAQRNSPQNIYIQSATLNGKPLKRSWFSHAELAAGGDLRLMMGPKPNRAWGAALADRPRSGMPAGMSLPPLPTPAGPPMPPARLTLPARLSAAEAAAGFTSDEAYTDGATSKNDAVIDVGAAHAAPAAVYQSERYGAPLIYTLPVPPGGPYTVRLHFAELFDADPGSRIENVSINGKPVLTDFEIFAAGGLNKAVVKEFPGIRPDKNGNITLSFATTAASPDQNAKVSAIEILP